jgi:hypothetical protein
MLNIKERERGLCKRAMNRQRYLASVVSNLMLLSNLM